MILSMLSNFVIRSAAAFGGTPFRLNKCTALGSAGTGAAAGAAAGGVPGDRGNHERGGLYRFHQSRVRCVRFSGTLRGAVTASDFPAQASDP